MVYQSHARLCCLKFNYLLATLSTLCTSVRKRTTKSRLLSHFLVIKETKS